MREPERKPSLRREAAAVVKQGALMMRHRNRRVAPVAGARVVIFIHGFGATGPVFDPLRAHVGSKLGVETVDFTYGSFSRFDQVVSQFEAHVERIVPRATTVSLVGHSLGGLIARWWVQERGGHTRIDRIVTLATPHAGTRASRFAVGPLRRALHPKGPVVRRLKQTRDKADPHPHHAIVAGADHMCTPPSSAAALPGAEIVWFDDLGHNELLYDARVHAVVEEALE